MDGLSAKLRIRLGGGALAGAGALLALAAAATPALADTSPPSAAPTGVVKLSVKQSADKPEQLVLTSRVQGAAGTAGRSVTFYVVTRQFGDERTVPIGSADLERDGTASVTYRPTWNGDQRFVAHLDGDPATAPSGSASYQVTASTEGPYYPLANQPRPFGPLGRVFVDVLLATVALVWLTLVLTVVRVARGLPHRA